MPKKLKRIIPSGNFFQNLCFKQVCIKELQTQLEPYLLYLSAGEKKWCVSDKGQALQSLFCRTPWLKEAGWIVEDLEEETVWFVNDQVRFWSDSLHECEEGLYFRYGAFLIEHHNTLNYVTYDKKQDLVIREQHYKDLPTNQVLLKNKDKQKTSKPTSDYLTNFSWLLNTGLQIALPFFILMSQLRMVKSQLSFFNQSTTNVALNAVNLNGFSVIGIQPNERLIHVRFIGDVNGDGKDDLLISSYFSPPTFPVSVSYVLLGTKIVPYQYDLTRLNGRNGFKIPFSNAGFCSLTCDENACSTGRGNSIGGAGIGDINGDGFKDIAFGTHFSNGKINGGGFVIFGRKLFTPVTDLTRLAENQQGFYLDGLTQGSVINGIGDVNGDGFDDMMVCVFEEKRCYVIFGRKNFPARISVKELDGNNGFTITEMPGGSNCFGFSISSAGDFNGDGIADILIGHPGADTQQRILGSTIIFGKKFFTNETKVENLDGKNGVRLFWNYRMGFSVAKVGDFNGDGIADVVISGGSPLAPSVEGAMVIFGRREPFPSGILDTNTLLDGRNGTWIYNGWARLTGYAVSSIGDINNSGVSGVILGAPAFHFNRGSFYLVYGRKIYPDSPAIKVWELSAQEGQGVVRRIDQAGILGISVTGGGDFNGDRVPDIAVSAPDSWSTKGEVYIDIINLSTERLCTSSFSLLALSTDKLVQAIAYEDSLSYQLQVSFLNVTTDGEIIKDKPILTLRQTRDKRVTNFNPILSRLNNQHFLLQYDLDNTQEKTILKTVRFSFDANKTQEITTEIIGSSYTHGVWPTLQNTWTNIIVDKSDNPKMQNNMYDASGIPVGLPLVAFTRPIFHRSLFLVEIGLDRQLCCYYAGMQSSVLCQLFPVSRARGEFQLGNPNQPANSAFFVFPTNTVAQFTYFAFENNAQGPFTWQTYIYKEPSELSLIDKKSLLDIMPHEQVEVLRIPGQAYLIIYSANSQVFSQQFTLEGEKFGIARYLFSLTDPEEVLFSTALLENSRDYVVGARFNNQTRMQIYTRPTLWQRQPLGNVTTSLSPIEYRMQHLFSSLGNQEIVCQFEQLSGPPMRDLELRPDCSISGYITNAPVLLEFQITANNGETWLSDIFRIQTELTPMQPLSETLLFEDQSSVRVILNYPQLSGEYFNARSEFIIKNHFATIKEALWIDSLLLSRVNNRQFIMSWVATRNNSRQSEQLVVMRNTLWKSGTFNNFTVMAGDPIELAFDRYFSSTIDSRKIACHFELFTHPWPAELRTEKDKCRLEGRAPYSPGLFGFNLTANDSQTILHDHLFLTVNPRPFNLSMLLWLWLLLPAGCGLSAIAFITTGIIVYRCRKEENWAQPMLGQQRWNRDIETQCISDYISFIDNQTPVTRTTCVLSAVGNIKSTVPNHISLFLESLNEAGEITVQRFELVTPMVSSPSKIKSKYSSELKKPLLEGEVSINVEENTGMEYEMLEQKEIQASTSTSKGFKEKIVISMKEYSRELAVVQMDANKMEEVFFRLVVQARREKCYFLSWQITTEDAEKLRHSVKADQIRYETEEHCYSIFGKKSFLSRYAPCFFGPSGMNCFDWVREKVNELDIPEESKIPEGRMEFIATRSTEYFPQTRGNLKYACLC